MIDRRIRDALLAARGAYDALKLIGADRELPGYETCVRELEEAIKLTEPIPMTTYVNDREVMRLGSLPSSDVADGCDRPGEKRPRNMYLPGGPVRNE